MDQKISLKKLQIIYNEITRTEEHSNEINQGVMTAIRKLDKPKGLFENLRPLYYPH